MRPMDRVRNSLEAQCRQRFLLNRWLFIARGFFALAFLASPVLAQTDANKDWDKLVATAVDKALAKAGKK